MVTRDFSRGNLESTGSSEKSASEAGRVRHRSVWLGMRRSAGNPAAPCKPTQALKFLRQNNYFTVTAGFSKNATIRSFLYLIVDKIS